MAGIPMKSTATLVAKFKSRVSGAGQFYTDGVNNTTKSQSENAIAAKERWAEGVQQAVSNDLFAKGLKKSGDAKWKANASSKGGQRWSGGAAAAAEAWGAGFQPFADVMTNISLPPRMPRGDPSNAQRSAVVQQALHARRLAG